jgi:hypothetical protein
MAKLVARPLACYGSILSSNIIHTSLKYHDGFHTQKSCQHDLARRKKIHKWRKKIQVQVQYWAPGAYIILSFIHAVAKPMEKVHEATVGQSSKMSEGI